MSHVRRFFAAFARPGIGLTLLLALAALTVSFVVQLLPAFASSPPSVSTSLKEEAVGSTRAHIEASLSAGGNVEIQWHGEYATSEQLLNEGKGTPAGSGNNERAKNEFNPEIFAAIGTTFVKLSDETILQHLEPGTKYYARFHVENSTTKETAERTFVFTTLPLAKPEAGRSLEETLGQTASFTGPTSFFVGRSAPRSAQTSALIETNGSQTEYAFEYAPAENGHAPVENSPAWVAFGAEATGTVTVAEDFREAHTTISGLAPETIYFARLKLKNALGSTVETDARGGITRLGEEPGSFETLPATPQVASGQVRNVTATSAYATGSINLDGSPTATHWRFEIATSSAGPWSPVAGAEGSAAAETATEAETEVYAEGAEGPITGLQPGSTYYLRLNATNGAGEAKECRVEQSATHPEQKAHTCEPVATAKNTLEDLVTFTTSGPPSASTSAVHGLHGEALRLLGTVNVAASLTSSEQTVTVGGAPASGSFTLSFKGQTTAPIAFNAPASEVQSALDALGRLTAASGSGVRPAGRTGSISLVLTEGSRSRRWLRTARAWRRPAPSALLASRLAVKASMRITISSTLRSRRSPSLVGRPLRVRPKSISAPKALTSAPIFPR